MKNNKKSLYLLLPLVLGIWGTIAFKIIAGLKDKSAPAMVNTQIAPVRMNSTVDTFSIINHYRDPFLSRLPQARQQTVSVTPSPNPQTPAPAKKQNPPPASLASWPTVTYTGEFKNQKTGKQVVLLAINSQSYTVKPGETIDGIHLCKVYRDSVELKMGKEKKVVRK